MAADAHFGVSAERNAVAPTASQSDISPVNGRNGLIHRVSNAHPLATKDRATHGPLITDKAHLALEMGFITNLRRH